MSKQSVAPTLPVPSQPLEKVLAGVKLDGEGSLTQQVYRLLRDKIVKLALPPNQFLSEKDVAASLDISKTPVREAFIRLSEDGIVCIVPKSGTYVAPIDFNRAMEGFFIWSALESSCAWQAAQQHGMDDISRLRELLIEAAEHVAVGNAAGFSAVDDRFHQAILAMADVSDAEKLVEASRFEIDRIIGLSPGYFVTVLAQAHQDHADLVNAIALHEADAARVAMERHIDRHREMVAAFFDDAELQELFASVNRKRPRARRARKDKAALAKEQV